MPKVSGDIPNLINGVSQQAPALRLPTQAEEQLNYYSTIVEGLRKRPPAEHIAKILDALPEGAFFHIINRDLNERYVMIITGDTLRVFDFDGNEKTVTAPDGIGYLASGTPRDDFRALTVADYTFLTNRTVTCAMDETVRSPARPYEAVVNIIAGNYGKTYSISINGVEKASVTTPDGSSATQSPQVATTVIASGLYDDLLLSLGNDGDPWAVGIHANALHIVNYDEDFTIAVSDGANGNATRLAKDTIQKFSDLPNYGPQDFVIEVGNSEGTTLDNYWVRADKGGSNNNSKVVWRETTKPDTVLAMDASTLPHVLVRNPDGTFTFKRATWDERKCGDGEKISPDPSFIGSRVQDIVFHRNRLVFLADENTIMSRSGSFFDFFRTTATALLDDDPIDVASTHIKVSFLKHAIPHQDYLLLFSNHTQFRLAGNDLLTAKSVSIRPLTEFNTSEEAAPIANGGGVFFASDDQSSNKWAAIFEYTLDKALETANADDITAHVPSYLPSGLFRLVGSPDENTIIGFTRGAPDSMFVYRYYWVNDEKVQSSWSRWTFDGATILNGEIIGSELYYLAARDGAVFLEKLRLEPAAKDDGLPFLVYLDRRVHSDRITAPSYDAGTNRTTYTLPYAPTALIKAVVVPGGTGVVGSEARVASVAGNTVIVTGDTRTRKLMFGYPYVSRYRFSTFYVRQQGANGASMTRTDGRLQVMNLSVTYNKSAYFRLEVATENRQTVTYPFNGIMIGSPGALVGSVVLDSGRFNVPVLSRNDRVTIDIVNDSWLPSNFLSASWHGVFNAKSRQV